MEMSQQDWMAKWALYSPKKVAVKEYESGKTLTYEQINNAGGHLALYLTQDLGLRKGDRMAVLADHGLEYIALFSAMQKSGIVMVPLNYRLSQTELEYIIRNADPKVIFIEEKYTHLKPTDHPVKIKDLGEIKDRWNTDIKSDFRTQSVDEQDPVFLLYTAGTTGFPKGVRYSHKMLFWNSINTSISLIINTETVSVNMMPPFHTGGWNVLVTPVLHHGGYQCLLKKFEPAVVNQILKDEKVTVFMGVPTMCQMMASQENFSRECFTSVLYIIVGGEPMPIPLIEKYAAIGVAIRQGYGMTEVGPNLTSLHQDDAIRKKGSIGRNNFYVDIRVVREDGFEAAPDEPGELWIRGPMVMPGYWNNPEMTQSSFSDDGVWFKTGDIVIVDEEHYIYVVDRLKNMYISGGENIYPAEIEKVLIQHESIEECVVVGVKDPKWGEVGKAFIVIKKGKTPPTGEELAAFCGHKLARFKIPKSFRFLDEIPKNDAGKLDRKKLKSTT